MTISSTTLRPGFLVALKTSVRGNVHYARRDLESTPAIDGAAATPEGAAVARWEMERTIDDPVEHDRAKKARTRACGLIRSVCSQTAFGLLCPEVSSDKLDAAVAAAKVVVEEFNASSSLTTVTLYVLAGRVMPDDVEAVRAINSEITELMAAMAGGVEGGDAAAIREAASRVKGIGEMLTVDAQTKVEMAVATARAAASQIVRDQKDGKAIGVDKSAIRKITELRAAFLDFGEDEVAAAAPKAAAALDLEDSAIWKASNADLRAAEQGEPR